MNGRQPLSVLKKADEIKVQYEDIEKILDYIETLPDKTIILDIPTETLGIDWNLLQMYSEKISFMVSLHNLELVNKCKELNIKFYWAYPITSYYELRGIIDLEPCYIMLGAPLYFDLKKVKSITSIPIRLCPNLAFEPYISRKDGICGTWIRPEDVETYEEFVSALEFRLVDFAQERVLYHVYAENKTWPGNLNLLLANFNVNVDNRAIPEEIGEARINCGQRCMIGSGCRFCVNAIKFSNLIREKASVLREKEQN